MTIANAALRGITIKKSGVQTFLYARLVLDAQPEHAAAQTIVRKFRKLLASGERVVSFVEFISP